MDKKTIARNFSRYAHSYDKYADIQNKAASELIGLMKEDNCRSILEIGCGTGNYTALLRERFKAARIKAVDISEKMIEVSSGKLKGNGVEFITADAETLNMEEQFDFVTSNASLQWFGDLDEAVKKYGAALKKGGVLSFSLFGPLTFRELGISVKNVLGDVFVPADSFIGRLQIEKLLKENFTTTLIKESFYEESFACLRDLLRKIKFSGIRGEGLGSGVVWTPRLLQKIEEAYLDNFKRISAAYQIFYCEGRK